jgi:hypothetical protein
MAQDGEGGGAAPLERWVTCKSCGAPILMPERGEPPPVFRARCDACRAQGVYVAADIFARPRRTH